MHCKWNQKWNRFRVCDTGIGISVFVSAGIRIRIDSAWLFLRWNQNRNQLQKIHAESESIPHDRNQAQVWSLPASGSLD